MTTLLADDWFVARKNHQCNACLGTITAGDRYRRQRCKYDDIYTYKCHALCDAAYWLAHREAGLWDDDEVSPEEVREVVGRFFEVISS